MTVTPDEWAVLALRLLLVALLWAAVAVVVWVALGELAALARQPPPAATPGRLVALAGSPVAPGTTWPLRERTTIGRAADNLVAIDDPFLSGRHAEIVFDAGAWWVRDMGSTNGTLLNGARVGSQAAIAPGDVLQFGGIRLQVLPLGDGRQRLPA